MFVTFPTRKIWSEHEFTHHRFREILKCHLCSSTFPTENHLIEHLQQKHGLTQQHSRLLAISLLANSRDSTLAKDVRCPLCLQGGWSDQRKFVTHLGRHLEEIALSVLPREVDSDSNESSECDESLQDNNASWPPFPKEIHEKSTTQEPLVFCPFAGCNRSSVQGFTREENLHEHLARRHGMEGNPNLDLPQHQLQDISSDLNFYTCTYHGCTAKFDSPAEIQKHKSETHRQMWATVGTTSPRQDHKSDLSIADLQTDEQTCGPKSSPTGRDHSVGLGSLDAAEYSCIDPGHSGDPSLSFMTEASLGQHHRERHEQDLIECTHALCWRRGSHGFEEQKLLEDHVRNDHGASSEQVGVRSLPIPPPLDSLSGIRVPTRSGTQYTPEQWAAKRDIISQLYGERGLSLREVKEHLRIHHNFRPTFVHPRPLLGISVLTINSGTGCIKGS
jgi:Clr5 domain